MDPRSHVAPLSTREPATAASSKVEVWVSSGCSRLVTSGQCARPPGALPNPRYSGWPFSTISQTGL